MDLHQCLRVATGRRAAGEDWNAIPATLAVSGATRLDMTRIVRDLGHVRTGDAMKIVNESGAVEPQHFTVVISQADPWYEEIFGERADEGEPPPDVR